MINFMRRPVVAFLSLGLMGAFSSFALAPYYYTWILLLTLPYVWWQIDARATWKSAIFYGLAFGYGYFLTGLYWIANALLVDANQFGWLVPLARFGIPLLMAFSIAGACLLYVGLRPKNSGLARWLWWAVCWVVFELVRGHLWGGFPWNLIGYTLVDFPVLTQPAAVVGAYGLSVWVVLMMSVPRLLMLLSKRTAVSLGVVLIVLNGGIVWWGQERLAQPVEGSGQQVRLVQPNIQQTQKWDESTKLSNLQTLMALSQKDAPAKLKAVIWPETAVPFDIGANPDLRQWLKDAVPKNGYLITGSPRITERDQDVPKLFNSLFVLNDKGDVAAVYNKTYLVPFGEYVPFGSLLPLPKIAPGWTDFSRGPGAQSLDVAGLTPFSALICYEVIFSGDVVNEDGRAQWIVNITNDAWYGDSAGPYQHLSMVQVRAVEEGVPVMRVANTGVSAAIDPFGRIIDKLALNDQGVIDQNVPLALTSRPLYAKFGRLNISATLLLITIACFLIARRSRES